MATSTLGCQAPISVLITQLTSDEGVMKIYVSGPPTKNIDDGTTLHAVIYKTIAKKLEEKGEEHKIEFPIRTAELDKLDARDFFATMSKKIEDAEHVITVFDHG